MATKEDILEQLVEEYLLHQGYFVRHNIKFLPDRGHADFNSQKDSNHSDIDVIGLHPLKDGPDRVIVVSCKSWQGGFYPENWIRDIREDKIVSGRKAWKAFRELTSDKWSSGFLKEIKAATGTLEFTYVVAVTKVVGDPKCWEENLEFRGRLGGNPIKVLEFRDMITFIHGAITNTLAGTEVGRMLQLFKAAGLL